MSKFKHELANDVSEGWEAHGYRGWRPSMAYPLFVGFGLKKAKCGCGRVFKKVEDFYAHYLYQAVWNLESTMLPSEWKDFTATSESAPTHINHKEEV